MTNFWIYLGWFIFVVWVIRLGPMWIELIRPRKLKDCAGDRPADNPWPKVSVIVPARDEGVTIEKALASLRRLDYPALELIFIDDRSRDQTGPVMDQMAAEDSRIQVVHVHELPTGWLGKNHAMHQGYQRSSGAWLLFTDGDVIFEPDSLRRAVNHLERVQRDHLTIFPDLIPGGWLENAAITMFGMLLMIRTQPWLIRTKLKHFYCGVGAFNLIRRSTYEAIGTHERMALEVADDIKLGKLVKMHDFKQDMLVGEDQVRVRWQVGLGGVINGLTKNAFAGLEFKLTHVVVITFLLALAGLSPYVGLILLPYPACLGHLLTLLFVHATLGGFHVRLRQSAFHALLFPFSLCVLIYIMWRSTVVTLKNGGVTWRETFYPLEALRRGLV